MAVNNNTEDPKYRKKIYDFLSTNFADFKRTEADFYKKLDTDSNYAGQVYDVISKNYSDFGRPRNEFLDLMLPSKKKEPSEVGGEAGTSARPSDSGKGFGGLKPVAKQPTQVFKEQGVGEDTMLARKMERAQRPAISTTGVRLPAAPKVVAEEKAVERALAPKLETRVAKDEQGWLANTVSALDRGFYKNLIGNPIKGLATVVQYGTEAMTGGRVKEGPVSDALNKLGDWFNNAIDEIAPQDPEFKNSLSDQFAQAFGQVGSIVLTGGLGAGGRAAGIATQAVPSAGRLAPAVAAGKELVSEITSPAAISAGLTMGQAEFDRAKKAGASDDQAFEAFYKNAAVGSILEKIPVMQFLKRFNNATAGGVANYIKTKGVAGITGGLEEATTEVLQQVYANKTAKDIYNTNQDIFEGLTESGGVGFGVGFLLNAMGANAKLLRKQGKEAEAQLVDAQIKEFESRAEKGPEVPPAPSPAAAAEELVTPTEEIKAEVVEPEVTPQVPAAEEKTYRVEYFDPESRKMTHQMFATEAEGEAFKKTLTREQTSQGVTSYFEKAPAKGVGEVAPEAAPEVPAAPEKINAINFAKKLEPSSKTIKNVYGDIAQNYINKDGVEVTLKDDLEGGSVNGVEVQGDVQLDFIGNDTKRGEGLATKELNRIIEEADKNNISISLVVDSDQAVKGTKSEKGLSNEELKKWYESKGFIFNKDGLFGYRPKKSEDSSIYKIEKYIAKKGEVNKNNVNYLSSPQDLQEYFNSGNLEEGSFYEDGTGDIFKIENGKIKEVENVKYIPYENKEFVDKIVYKEAPQVPAAPVEALKDVESTTKALQSEIDKGFKFTANFGLPFEQLKTPNQVSEAYHKAKAEGTNPVLVKAVEDLLVGEVAPKAAPQVPAAPEKTQDEVAKEQTRETDLLLGGQAEQRRKDGKYTKDGVEYVRNPKGQGIASEVTGEVRFTNEVSLPFKYKLVEAETLQPSHQDGIRNPLHFIPEAQPKNRNDVGSLQAEESFANNPRFSELGENTNAYSGAPVVNERGEVVQGNNRSAGLRKGYQRNNPQYKNDLAANAEQFGFTREQVEGMKNPVLVREVAVSDQGAVELGNYDVKDLETGGKRRIDPIAVTRRMPFDVKGRIADLFTGEETLNQAIRANQKRLLELLNPYLNQAQRNTITKDGALTDAGIKDLEAVVQQFLFDNGDTALPDLFENLSATQKEGLRKSLPYVFSVSPEKSLVPDIQEAILAVNDFNASGAGEFDAWLLQGDIFNEGKTPKDKYTPLELAIAKTLVESKTQKEIAKKFADYADVVKDKEADMFEPARPGKSRKEGVLEIFKAEDYAKPISERGRKEAAPEKKPTPEPSVEKRAREAKREPRLPETEKRAEARKELRDAFNDLMNLGVAYDPRSQAEKQVRLTKAIINVIKQESIGAIKDLKKYIKDNIGFDISDNDAKYLLIESKKPEYAIQEPTAGKVPVQPKARAGEKVEAGVPPTRPPKAPEEGKVEGEEKRVSGIKKALVSKEVLESVDLDKTGDKQLLEAGRKIIDSGEVEPKLLIDKIIDEGRGVLSPAEVVAMITYKADIDTKIEDLTAEIEQLEASGQDIGTKGVELKNLQVEQRNFEIAAVITAQQQSMSFRLRRWMLDRTYSLQQQIAQYKKANGGTISPEVLRQFEKMDAEIQDLKKQIKEAEARKVDQEGQAAVENIAEDVKREDAKTITEEEIDARVQKGVEAEINKIYEQLPARRKSRADQAIAALERIQKRLRNKSYDASLGIPVAVIDMGITTIKNAIKAGVAIEKAIELGIGKIKDALKGKPFENESRFRKDLLEGFEVEGIKTEKEVAETPSINDDGTIRIPEKFLRDLVRKGINTIDGLTNAAFNELESQLPGLTKRQVRDAITQYGKTVNPTQDEIRQQLGAARRLGRLISELEDLKSMSKAEFALKYFKQPTPSKITEAEKNLKKQINSLARELKTDAQVLAQAKESAKRRIEELQRRLREKDYASRPKPIVKADAELEILLGKKQALQDKFEEEKKKAELKNRTIGQRIEDIALEIFSGISRALVAGFDLSAAFVQGTRRVFTNPVMSAKAFAEGLRQFASPSRMERFMQRYKGTYNYSVARNSGLAISDVDGTLSAKEQIFVTNWANTIYDLIANVVTLGHKPSAEFIKRINPLKASQRAFDGYMNYIRISSFELEMAALKNMGYTPDSNPEVYKAAADFVNTATGRANMGPLEASSKWLSTIMFAPRKVASELKLYSPLAFLYYANMPAPVRKRALIDFAKFSASVLVTHILVKAAIDTYGGDEEDYDDFWNSDSPNFLAFKIGDKRISFLGGIKSTIVFISRLIGQDFVDQYGIKTKFGERYGKKIDTKLDLTTQFLLGKASPGAGAIRDYLDKNPNYENDDEILQNLVVPMWLQDANELYKEDPIAVTAMFNMLAIIGANIRKVDMKQVQDQIIFKEKIKGKEVKRVVELTDAQKEEFQNLVKERAKIELNKIAPIVKKEKSGIKRAEYDKIAVDKAKKDAQKILEKRYQKLFRQFPIQEKEEDVIREKVKKKLK